MLTHSNHSIPTGSTESFLWGVATCGYQSEGGYNGAGEPKNNWFLDEDKGSVMPTGSAAEFWTRYPKDFQTCQQLGLNAFRMSLEWSRIQPSTHSGSAPAPAFDLAALDAYGDRIAACRQHGLEPVITLHHFTHPAWLGQDAWLSEVTVDCFVEYVRVAVTHINRRLTEHHQLPPIRWYITINEPNILVPNTYFYAQFPADSMPGVNTSLRAYSHLLAAHIRAYNCIHDIYAAEGWTSPCVSLNTYCCDLYWSEKIIWDLLLSPQRGVKFSQLRDYATANARHLETALRDANLPFRRDLPYQAGRFMHWFSNWFYRRNFDLQPLDYFLQELEASPRQNVFDYIAIDYYDPFIAHIFRLPSFSDFEFKTRGFRSWLMSGITSKWWDWRSLPEGLHFFCKYYAEQLCWDGTGYRYPILIAENGMALRRKPDNSVATRRTDQIRRSQFLEAHVEQVLRLMDEGIPMMGYLHWSLTDNYEWGSYTPRFGLLSIDFTQERDRLMEDHLGDRPSETYARLIQHARRRYPTTP
ncbi:MAG: glycoside hydrolase family 1 protein [Leptolyngbyaceae cyanobacterium RU_5_1]|nr:glycoside hydrolase family 1 protein [Leptolyngbyaceae cyanobacterium RU_5_1]